MGYVKLLLSMKFELSSDCGLICRLGVDTLVAVKRVTNPIFRKVLITNEPRDLS